MGLFSGKSFSTAATTFIASALVAFMAVSPSDSASTTNGTASSDSAVDVPSVIEELSVPLPLDGSEPVMGSQDAKIQLVGELLISNVHIVRWWHLIESITRVESKCEPSIPSTIQSATFANPNVGAEGHANACLAATATDCALKQKFEMGNVYL